MNKSADTLADRVTDPPRMRSVALAEWRRRRINPHRVAHDRHRTGTETPATVIRQESEFFVIPRPDEGRPIEWVAPRSAPDLRQDGKESLRKDFRRHAERWKDETGHLSNPAQIARHPDYLAIIGMGEKALPLIFESLREEEDHWYVALRLLTGASPVPSSASGNARLVQEAWLQWGRDHHYLA